MTKITEQFAALQRSYGLTTPRQIKDRILWKHIKLLMKSAYDSPETEATLHHYNTQWKLLEQVENMKEKEKGR